MKRFRISWLVPLFALSAYAAPIRLVTGEFTPFTGEELADGGISSRVVKAALNEAGLHEIVIQFRPWGRGYQQTLLSHYTATYPYAWSRERAKLFLYSAPINVDTLSWYSRPDHDRARNGAWHKLSLCIPLGWNITHAEQLMSQYQMRLEQPKGVEQCLLMLERKRVDLVPMNDRVVFEASNRLFGTPFKFLPLLQHRHSDTFYLIISRLHPNAHELMEAFNQGLAALRADGRYDQLLLSPQVSPQALSSAPINPRQPLVAAEGSATSGQ